MSKRKPWTRKQRHAIDRQRRREAKAAAREQRAWERKDRRKAQTVDDMLRGVQDA